MKTTTQTDLMKERIAETKQRVQELTRISVDEQNTLIYEAAFEWLESIGCVGDDQLNMTSTSHFWGFWKLEWFYQDREFLTSHRLWYHTDPDQVYWYNHAHKIVSSPRVEAGYHQVIKQLSKSK